jgi:hypothetical protein
MRQVFPTPLSPRKIILCVFFEILELLEEDIDIFEYYPSLPQSPQDLHLVVLGREADAEKEVLPVSLGEVLQADQVVLRVVLLPQAQARLLVVRLDGQLVSHAKT